MEKFIPYEKLSKKEKRKIDQARRQTWGDLNPVARKPENSKAYNRNKARNWKRAYHEPVPGLLLVSTLFLCDIIRYYVTLPTTIGRVLLRNVQSSSPQQ